MSLNPPSPPVHKLDCYLLLYIIDLNADMFSDCHALRTTRAASQVCQHWRNIMLDTPSLWAKLIDLDGLSSLDYDWLNELMRRSGTAPLWIRVGRGRMERPTDPSERWTLPEYMQATHEGFRTQQPVHVHHPADAADHFFTVTRENWHRIEKLVVSLRIDPAFEPARWTALCLPAPELDTFDVTFQSVAGTLPAEDPETTIATLFSEYAPKIRGFSLGSYTVHERAPWVCHLRTLHLDRAYSVRLALAVLASTDRLCELKIRGLADEHTSAPLPTVSLPHLAYLEYDGQPQLGATFLAHIAVPPGCALSIPAPPCIIPIGDLEEQLRVLATYTQYARRHLQVSMPRVISIDDKPFRRICVQAGGAFPDDLPLSITFPVYNWGPHMAVDALRELALPELASAVELHLHNADFRFDPRLQAFFRCFASLETIFTDAHTLYELDALQNRIDENGERSVLFPLLKVINLDTHVYGGKIFGGYGCVNTVIADFILSRMRDGRPIATLRLLEPISGKSAPNFKALEKAKGLKVVYTRSGVIGDLEHICGSVN